MGAKNKQTNKTLTRYLAPLRGWIVPYPAHHCRKESSYCLQPHTAHMTRTMRGREIMSLTPGQHSSQSITDFNNAGAQRKTPSQHNIPAFSIRIA